MVQLNQSMMERYEITAHRPDRLCAVIVGADSITLGVAARHLEDCNIGAVCVGTGADRLRAQDGMFTLLIRQSGNIRRERVVQSVLRAECDPAGVRAIAEDAALDHYLLRADASDADFACMIAMLKLRRDAGIAAPSICLLSDRARRVNAIALGKVIAAAIGDDIWCSGIRIIRVQYDHLCGYLNPSERAIEERKMNYRDDFLMWAEFRLNLTADGENELFPAGDFDAACRRHARTFDAAALLIAPVGYLWGLNTYAEAMTDPGVRDFAAHAFYDELMPRMGCDAESVIDAFDRLQEPMNALPLLSSGHLLSGIVDEVLPAIRAYAHDEFDAPPRTALAIAAAIMLYCGARCDGETGSYRVLRGEGSDVIRDDPSFLDAFARMSHDMPAESIAYAVLADRGLWGEDLRQIDGLEMRVASWISVIQRTGIRNAVKLISE